ncbi:MAG TPA: YezD family protein [Candidatus Binataceae bacterium]|nr:YezD family protein [Candidatus Binataceae bacterium]
MNKDHQATRDEPAEAGDEALAKALSEVARSVKSVNFGSIEIVIHNSRIVQIERKEKIRFDKG